MPDGPFPMLAFADAAAAETGGVARSARLAMWLDDPLIRLVLRADGLDRSMVFAELVTVGDALASRRPPLRDRRTRGGPFMIQRRVLSLDSAAAAEPTPPPPGGYRRCLLRLAAAARSDGAVETTDGALLARLDREGVRLIPDDTAVAIQAGIDALDRWCFSAGAPSSAAVADACFHLAEHLLPYLDAAEPSFVARVRAVIVGRRASRR